VDDDSEPLTCSFCGKPEAMVEALIQASARLDDGRPVCICDDCVDLCVEILEAPTSPAAPALC